MVDGLDRSLPVRLLWMEEGIEPLGEQFISDQSDPVRGPETWCIFEMAMAYSMNVSRTDELVPWIRVGDEIIGPRRVRELYESGGSTTTAAECLLGPTSASQDRED